jgi:ABC-type phosphate transport system substrate-binding protein
MMKKAGILAITIAMIAAMLTACGCQATMDPASSSTTTTSATTTATTTASTAAPSTTTRPVTTAPTTQQSQPDDSSNATNETGNTNPNGHISRKMPKR